VPLRASYKKGVATLLIVVGKKKKGGTKGGRETFVTVVVYQKAFVNGTLTKNNNNLFVIPHLANICF